MEACLSKEFIKYKLNNNENRKYVKLYLKNKVFRPTEDKILLEAVIKKF